jgi:osmotically-inducible protein OsmY
VKAVLNEIELKPTVNTTDIKVKIEDALKRDAQIEAKDITVETSGALVTLRGCVHSLREHDDAEHAAFSAPGVGSVSNLLTVSY